MKIINRQIEKQIIQKIKPNKVIIILGPRRSGKTVLLKKIAAQFTEPVLFFNGEDMAVFEILRRRSVEHYRQILGKKRVLIIDEAQKIPDIGLILKLMIDEIKDLKIIASGSSSFDMTNQLGEPLTGRKISFNLLPLSETEFKQVESIFDKKDKLHERLVFGNYPELIHLDDREDKTRYLQEIVQSYLLKDILTFENIKNSEKIFQLLRLIAYQIGNLVSCQELGRQLSMSKNTVDRYLDLLSKVFVVFKLTGFSKNLRKEVTKNAKWYFYDNGIRNAITANLNPIELRDDHGLLWENYLAQERIKFQKYNHKLVNNYFWRTYDQQEIDWIEERDGKLFAYEFKWKEMKLKVPAAWKRNYPDSEFEVINSENYGSWLL